MYSESPDMHGLDSKPIVFVFDFDGVVTDSVGALKEIYLQFLDSFDKKGSEAEFRLLNGPKLREIVALLKQWHNLAQSEDELLEHYMQRIREHYPSVSLFDGVRDALQRLTGLGIPTALATSSSREEVEKILAKQELTDTFKFIITGDDVEIAKPAPDIYLQVKAKFPAHRCIVLEDSENGMKAALEAGIETIFFDPEQRGTSLPVTGTLYSFRRFHSLLEEIRVDCFTLALCTEAEVRIVDAPALLDETTEATVSLIWENELHKRKLRDTDILCYSGHSLKEGRLLVDAYISKYRYFLARFMDPSIQMTVTPLCVSGITLDAKERTLAARRGDVTEYPGLLELVPSGGIEVANVIAGRANYEMQILDELMEETGITRSAVTTVSPYCLIYDSAHGVVDLGCAIRLLPEFKDVLQQSGNSEYQVFQVISPETLSTDADWVPGSGVMLSNWLFTTSCPD